MSRDSVHHFLGVPGSADPATLLGLRTVPSGRVQVEAALRDRLAEVFAHPEGRGEEAEQVRRRLRDAAAVLIARRFGGGPRRAPVVHRERSAPGASATVAGLTDFDRKVLAILIGCGGWNARSRAWLVSLAGRHGVTDAGLVRVMRGLSDLARRGLRLELGAMTPRRATTSAHEVSRTLARERAEAAEIARRLVPEIGGAGAGDVIRLCLLFGFLTILGGLLVVRMVFPERRVEPVAPVAVTDPTADAPVNQPRPPVESRLAEFRPWPTFRGNAVPPAAAEAADEAPEALADLDLVARKIAVNDDPADIVFRQWSAAIETIASGWVLLGESARAEALRAVERAVLEAGDVPTLGDRLLEAVPPARGRPASGVDVWRGAWRAGALGHLLEAGRLGPALAERARDRLGLVLGTSPAGTPSGFNAAAAAWLDEVAVHLAAGLETTPDALDRWEMWLAAQRALGEGARAEEALAAALALVLAGDTDLARPGPSVRVVGRLIDEMDWEGGAPVRRGLLALFDDERVSSRDLWVLTSLLEQGGAARWFDASLVVPDGAKPSMRRRVRDRIAVAWPAPEEEEPGVPGRLVPRLDPRLAERLLSVRAAIVGTAVPFEQLPRLEALVRAARFNEAAALAAAGRGDEAAAILMLAEAPPAMRRAVPAPAPAPARRDPRRTIGRDGMWSEAYRELRRNTAEKLELLRALRTQAGGDLGPIDAETFVREVFRGSPEEVRSLARALVVERFSDGPEVGMEMLDQFPSAPSNDRVSETIRRLTGRLLPAPRTEAWRLDARRALVEHVLHLRDRGTHPMDVLAARFAESLDARTSVVRRDAGAGAGTPDATLAAERLANAWRERAAALLVTGTVPDDLDGLARRRAMRRRLRDGSVQLAVAELVTVLEHLAYVAASEAPERAERVREIVEEAADRRGAARDVLVQAMETEQAVGAVWMVRLGLEVPVVSRRARIGRDPIMTRSAALLAAAIAARPQDRSWTARLEALDPSRPLAYLELGEEAADAGDGALARHLFALAGVLDPDGLGGSACLALSDLADDAADRRRLLALAALLGESRFSRVLPAELLATAEAAPGTVLAVLDAMGHYRRGRGSQANTALQAPGAMELLEACGPFLPGGVRRFLEDCRQYRGQLRPGLSASQVDTMLRLELALLAGLGDDHRPWSADLLVGRGQPLLEVDPTRLADMLGADGSRPWYRAGRWVAEVDRR